LLAGILQAVSSLSLIKQNHPARFVLDSSLQQFIAREWKTYQSRDHHLAKLLTYFEDTNWINNQSTFKLHSPEVGLLMDKVSKYILRLM
jgi:hypothetical protein